MSVPYGAGAIVPVCLERRPASAPRRYSKRPRLTAGSLVSVSFSAHARIVRDASRPYGRRVSSLRSCVERYGPLGWHDSLSFLEEIAGPYSTDEAALIQAVDALSASRAARVAALDRYAETRREAKRRGERTPRPISPNPLSLAIWFGNERRAALHVLRRRQTELSRLGQACGLGSVEARLSELADAAIGSGGRLDTAAAQALADILEMLRSRLTWGRYQDDPKAYYHSLRLWRIGRMLNDALNPDLAGTFPA